MNELRELVAEMDNLPHIDVQMHRYYESEDGTGFEYEVVFAVHRCVAAWTDLAVINAATQRVAVGQVSLFVGADPDEPLIPLFYLFGDHDADPDELAGLIREVIHHLMHAGGEVVH